MFATNQLTYHHHPHHQCNRDYFSVQLQYLGHRGNGTPRLAKSITITFSPTNR